MSACGKSKTMYLEVPIFSPITLQKKLLPPNIDLFIQATPAKNDFLIMSRGALATRNQKIEIRM